jgi:SAM-dependent methyltransferase
MDAVPADHPDRRRWNARYGEAAGIGFPVHRLAARALAVPPPDGPVLDLACGPSGSALAAAGAGRRVTAVDVSDVGLKLLAHEATRRGVRDLVTLVHADLATWTPPPGVFTFVLCTGFWERPVFGPAVAAVAPGGLLAWEAFTLDARRVRPGLPERWCLGEGEPASLLPAGFAVLEQEDLPDPPPPTMPTGRPPRRHGTRRGLLARRHAE